MKQQAKMLEREAAKVQQQEAKERQKILTELKKGNLEFAKVYAENAIRIHKEAVSIQRFSAKMGAVGAKLESAYRTQQVSMQIKNCVPQLESALKHMNKMKISEQMGSFERIFEDLDVKAADITGALDMVTGSSVQQDEVNSLLQQMMSEQGMDVGEGLAGAAKGQIANPNAAQ